MNTPLPHAEQLKIADEATEAAESGALSVYDAALLLHGTKGPGALSALNSEFTVDAIEVRRKAAAIAAAEAQIDRRPGASVKLSDRSNAMKRFVSAVNTINKAKGAGAASSTPGSDFRQRYDNPDKVINDMERNALAAERNLDITRRIMTGEAALQAAGFDDLYQMAVRKTTRDELEPLQKTGPEARAARIEAVERTHYPKDLDTK